MFPNFSYLAHYVIGTEPDNALAHIGTYGFFLALGIYLATVLFKIELKRKEKQGIFGNYDIYDQTGYKGKFTSDLMNGHTVFAVIGGLLGAKFLQMLENIPKLLEHQLLQHKSL
jgi:prolipoprotein diacylglyceryltransferase